jgi:hypothetical protein
MLKKMLDAELDHKIGHSKETIKTKKQKTTATNSSFYNYWFVNLFYSSVNAFISLYEINLKCYRLVF